MGVCTCECNACRGQMHWAPGSWISGCLWAAQHQGSILSRNAGGLGWGGCCSGVFRLLCGKGAAVRLSMYAFCSSYNVTRIWSRDVHPHTYQILFISQTPQLRLIFYLPNLSQRALSFNQETLLDIFHQYPNHSRIWSDGYINQLLLCYSTLY